MNYRLTLLGNLDLRDSNGAPINSVLQQPRRLALLVYLALAERDAMVKRDTLLGVFWPEMDDDKARRALSQAIHFLRRSLGTDAILTRGNEDVGLNSAIVDCDATTFLAAAKARDLRVASAAYTGDLLPGLFASGAPDFEAWLATAREALRRTAAEVFWNAAEDAKQEGQPVSAAASARRAAELASDNETATRRLMEFLDALDDRAGALDAYETLVRKLAAEFEAQPSAKTRELAERIRSKGEIQESARAEASELVLPRGPLNRLPWTEISRRGRTLAGTGIMMVAFLSLWGLSHRVARGAAVRTDASIAVDDAKVFDNSLRDVASSIISDINKDLVDVKRLRVASDARGGDAGVHFVLEPNVSTRNGELYMVASVVDVSSKTIVQSASFTAKPNDEASLNALAANVSEFARKTIGHYMRQAEIETVKGANADVLVQSGLARLRSDSLLKKGVGDYAMLTLNQAGSTVDAALEKDASLDLLLERAEISCAKMLSYLMVPLLDVTKANAASVEGIRFADAAIAKDSENAKAQELRGLFSFWQWMAAPVGRSKTALQRDEAERYLQRAVELNPLAGRAWNALSSVLLARGEFAQAYLAAEKAQTTDTYLEAGNAVTFNLFAAALETGDDDAATHACQDLTRRSNQSWMRVYCQLQLAAWVHSPSAADVQRADNLLATVASDEQVAPFMPMLNSLAAVVHAKGKDAARAEQLLKASETGATAGEAMPFRAWAMNELGHSDQAHSLLNKYIQMDPSTRSGVLRSVRFAGM